MNTNFIEYQISSSIVLLRSVDDVYAVTEKLERSGCEFQKKPDEGKTNMKTMMAR